MTRNFPEMLFFKCLFFYFVNFQLTLGSVYGNNTKQCCHRQRTLICLSIAMQ